MIAALVRLFPEPDSPTTPTDSPEAMAKDTPRSASMSPSRERKVTESDDTSSMGGGMDSAVMSGPDEASAATRTEGRGHRAARRRRS